MPTSYSATYSGTPSTAFNLNPTPSFGSGTPFGDVPGSLGLPNPAGDLSAQIPGLSTLNKTASGDILSKLSGTLSPGTINALQNASATFGTQSGMPGSGLSWNSLYGNIAGASESQQQQGLQDYSSFIPTVSGTQTVSPALQTSIAATNASNLAAPDPTASASYAQQLFDQYLQQMRGPAGGTGGIGNPAISTTGSASTLSGPNSPLDFGNTPFPSNASSGSSGVPVSIDPNTGLPVESDLLSSGYASQPTTDLLSMAGYGDMSDNSGTYGF